MAAAAGNARLIKNLLSCPLAHLCLPPPPPSAAASPADARLSPAHRVARMLRAASGPAVGVLVAHELLHALAHCEVLTCGETDPERQ